MTLVKSSGRHPRLVPRLRVDGVETDCLQASKARRMKYNVTGYLEDVEQDDPSGLKMAFQEDHNGDVAEDKSLRPSAL
jgi:hypothetical protein